MAGVGARRRGVVGMIGRVLIEGGVVEDLGRERVNREADQSVHAMHVATHSLMMPAPPTIQVFSQTVIFLVNTAKLVS